MNVKQNVFLKFSFYILFLQTISNHVLISKNITSSYAHIQKDSNENLSLELEYNPFHQIFKKSPTLAYCAIPELNKNTLHDAYFDNIQNKILTIGINKIENIINQNIAREIKFYDENYIVLYHAHRRELIVIHDIYKKLYEHFNHTKLQNFEFLRVPNPIFDKFQTPQDFIDAFRWEILNSIYPFNIFDNNKNVNRHILAVNTSLFGNTLSSVNKNISECTFKYFLKSSSITTIDIMNLCQEMFGLFKLASSFNKYKPQIQNLISLLAENEQPKTGTLLQIFIPKNLVNKIIYRSNRGGTPYYGVDPIWLFTPTSLKILESYTNNMLNLLNSNNYSKQIELDELQFRILITNQDFLNPYSGIKIFRHTSSTNNIKLYKKTLNELITDIVENNKQDSTFTEIFTNALKSFVVNTAVPYIFQKIQDKLKK